MILKIVSMAFADLHRYRHKVYVVWTQELSANVSFADSTTEDLGRIF